MPSWSMNNWEFGLKEWPFASHSELRESDRLTPEQELLKERMGTLRAEEEDNPVSCSTLNFLMEARVVRLGTCHGFLKRVRLLIKRSWSVDNKELITVQKQAQLFFLHRGMFLLAWHVQSDDDEHMFVILTGLYCAFDWVCLG